MKMVVAIIQPDRLNMVRESLLKAEISRITVSRCTGRGRAAETYLYRGQEVPPTLHPKVRLEIACNDEFVDITVNAILDAAKHGTGKTGDGKIFIMPLEQCIRISNSDTGSSAI